MAFTFQINHNTQFNHDHHLLEKAQKLTPELIFKQIKPVSLVTPVNDPGKFNHIGMKKFDEIINLPKYQLKRDDKLFIDFGNHYVGHFKVNIHHVGSPQDAPLALKIKFAEVPAEFNYHADDYDGWLSKSWIQEEIIHVDQLPIELKLPRRYAFRYVELKVIDTSPKWSVTFNDPQIIAESSASESNLRPSSLTHYPKLKKIYDTSVKTLHDCMQLVFEDGPKRDRRLWLGDLHLQALANYATYHNNDLVKRCLYLFAGMTAKDGRIPANVFTNGEPQPDDTFLLDYGLFFISTLDDYVKETNDIDALKDLYSVAKKQVDVALQYVSDGLYHLDDNYPVFIDWSHDFDKTTAGEAIIIYSFRQFLHLAKELKHDSDINHIQPVLQQMIHASREKLLNKQSHLFVSGPKQEINVASQVWMVLAEVVTGKNAQKTLTEMKKQLFPITGIATPYMYHHVAAAFFKAGLTADGISILTKYWGKMIDLGAYTYWEAFEPENPDYSPYGSPLLSSYCHAWGCTPVYLIRKYLSNYEE